MKDLLTTDFRNAPYWWDAAPLTESAGGALAPSYDAVIVGSGYTGLRAALTLARAGRSVAVFDKERPGYGASRRNAGFLGRTLKKSYVDLKAAKGAAHASAIYRDLMMAYESTLAFIEEEGIDCHAVRCGRLIAATSAAHYAVLERELSGMKADLGLPYAMLPRARLREEMATDLYDGGAVIPDLGSLHPGLYHRGLMTRALAAGVAIFGKCEVIAVEPAAGQGDRPLPCHHRRRTDARAGRGGRHQRLHAQEPALACTARHSLHRLHGGDRDAAAGTAGEAASAAAHGDRFQPRHRFLPAGTRFSRACCSAGPRPTAWKILPPSPALLHGRLARALPDLADVRLSHVWTGQCAGTFDMMPHIGCHDGIWYGMGYNFAGVPMGSFFGLKLAQKILGLPAGASAFDAAAFPTLPFYRGNPWFLPLAMRWFAWQDARLARRRAP